jgi:hypothetical protein
MSLTDEYLAAVAGSGPKPADIKASAQEAVADTMYFGRCLTRPAFLGQQDFRRLNDDLENVFSALSALPERLFGGDGRAFARAVGLTDAQAAVVLRGRRPTPSRLSRADIYRDETGFRLLELNMGSNIGGLDNAVLNEVMLGHRFIADFVAEHGLTYVDTLAELARSVLIEAEVPAGVRPLVAVVDTPESFPPLEAVLEKSARLLEPHGLDCKPCPLDRLEYRDDRVWLEGRPVDVVYRLFMVEDVLKPDVLELLEPLLVAVESGQVTMFTPMDSELFGTKGALALLSDETYRDRCTPAEVASLDRLLPWTRMVRSGPVTVDGEPHDLWTYALANRTELVLKPTAEHGGAGVTLGWQVDAATWQDRLTEALDRPYVIQRRVRPVPELFPADDGFEPWALGWGVFLVAGGFGGIYLRGTKDPDGMVGMQFDATGTCCFYQE